MFSSTVVFFSGFGVIDVSLLEILILEVFGQGFVLHLKRDLIARIV